MARKQQQNTVKLQRVEPRSAFRDPREPEAQAGMGKVITRSEKFVKRNRKRLKREGYIVVEGNAESKPVRREPIRNEAPREKAPSEPETAPEPKEVEAVKASAAARKLAEEYNIDLSKVDGSGKGGIVTKTDIENIMV